MSFCVRGVFALDVDEFGGCKLRDPVAIGVRHLVTLRAVRVLGNKISPIKTPMAKVRRSSPMPRPDKRVIGPKREIYHLL